LYNLFFFNEIINVLYENGVLNEPLAIDTPQTTINLKEIFASKGIKLVDGGKVMQDARAIKTQDEILCFNIAAAVSEIGHQVFRQEIKPGVRECEVVGKAVGAMIANGGCLFPEAPVFCSGERANRNSLDYTDKIIRPNELIMADPNGPMFLGYNTCYYRTYCCGKANTRQKEMYAECYELMYKAFEQIKPGNTTEDVAKIWPSFEKWGCVDEYEALEVATVHGLGLTLHEVPFADRINGLQKPRKFEPGMVGAIEYWVGREDPREGVKIEDMFVVTETGVECITKWPVEEITDCPF
jgi:Xaa-Pro dipeptidase